MAGFLRKATAAQSRALGPFLSDSDFKTPQTGLTIANTDIKLVVNGGASANKNSGGGTHRVNGVYGVTFDATDTATVGEIEVSVAVSGALLVWDKWTVVEAAVYDRDYVTSAIGYVDGATVNATKWNSLATVALPLVPTTAGRTLDVTTTGEAGIDWANIGNPTTTVNLSGTTIKAVTDAVTISAAAVWDYLTSSIVTAGSIGKLIVDNLNDTITSRMATYTQPTGFLAATFPTTVASTTNITAGTITTVTNLTNAPTAGDFTATMKTSIGTAVAASAVASVTGNVGGNVVGSVGSVAGNVTGSVGSVTGNIGGNLLGTLTTTERNAICDAALVRDWTSVGTAAARSTFNALRFLRNKWSISGGTLTVTKEDDSASAWTGVVTQTAGNPVSEIDPS